MSQDPPALSQIRIVLVEPAGPLNIGSAARVMKNFGLQHLVLVNPQCDPLGEEAMQMAVHAKDLLHSAQIVSSIPEALEGCYSAIATTARQRDINTPLERPEEALSALVAEASVNRDSSTQDADQAAEASANKISSDSSYAVIFGPEDRGLSNEELIYAQRFVKIPTSDRYSALNLAQAVAVCCYELYRISLQREDQAPSSSPSPLAADTALRNPADSKSTDSAQNLTNALRTSPLSDKQTESRSIDRSASGSNPEPATDRARLDELEGYYQHLESVLLSVEYLYPHTAASRMRKVRQLLQKAHPTSAEVALLRGMLRQVEWALAKTDSKQG